MVTFLIFLYMYGQLNLERSEKAQEASDVLSPSRGFKAHGVPPVKAHDRAQWRPLDASLCSKVGLRPPVLRVVLGERPAADLICVGLAFWFSYFEQAGELVSCGLGLLQIDLFWAGLREKKKIVNYPLTVKIMYIIFLMLYCNSIYNLFFPLFLIKIFRFFLSEDIYYSFKF